jgi:thymidylate synthase
MFFNGALHELLWFLRGDTDIKYLQDNGVHIWDEDGYRWYKKTCIGTPASFEGWKKFVALGTGLGDLGKIYSHQWRSFGARNGRGWTKGIDQINVVIDGIKKNPESRYHVVSAWNPSELDEAALPPCHMLFMFNCREISLKDRIFLAESRGFKEELDQVIQAYGKLGPRDAALWVKMNALKIPKYHLDCDMTQRSCDTPLGVPFNIASYALLTMIIAKLTNTVPGEFIWSGKDVHIYENQIDAVYNQLERTPLPLPIMEITGDWDSIEDIKFEDFKLRDYKSHDSIKYPLSTGLILR